MIAPMAAHVAQGERRKLRWHDRPPAVPLVRVGRCGSIRIAPRVAFAHLDSSARRALSGGGGHSPNLDTVDGDAGGGPAANGGSGVTCLLFGLKQDDREALTVGWL
jgi:hypothetical protein